MGPAARVPDISHGITNAVMTFSREVTLNTEDKILLILNIRVFTKVDSHGELLATLRLWRASTGLD